MSAQVPAAAARELDVRLTPLGRRFLPLSVAALGLAEVVALLDATGSGADRAGTLLFVPLLALLLAALAPWLARRQLGSLEVAAPEPVTGFAGEELILPLHLANRSRRLSARDVIVSASVARFGVVRPVGLVDTLGPGRELKLASAWRLGRRGRWRELRLALVTTFPFGLVEARLVLRVPADVLALPRPGALRESAFPAAGGVGERTARRLARRGTADLRGLREWRRGEDQHLVHWKVSARRGQLVLRELEGEERAPARLILLGAVEALPVGREGEAGWHEGFELAVSLAATLAEVLVARHPALRLSLAAAHGEEQLEVRGRERLDELLAALAEAQPHRDGSAGERARALVVAARKRGETVFLVHAGGPRVDPACAGCEAALLDVDGALVAELFVPARRHPAVSVVL